MDFLEELEEQFKVGTTLGPELVVIHGPERTSITNAFLGVDFIAGVCLKGAIAIPLSAISQTLGSELPESRNTSLNQFLSAQKTPVRLEYQSHEALTRCWLLNVLENWLRVATPSGVGWIPIQSLKLVRINPVDN